MVVVGLTLAPLPVAASVPPHDPVYHLTVSLVPPPPPFSVRVVELPLQIVAEPAVADVGSADFVFTVSVALPSALTAVVPQASVTTQRYL